jgi:hypothetical protein
VIEQSPNRELKERRREIIYALIEVGPKEDRRRAG